MNIKIYISKVPLQELKAHAQATFGDMVKGVVDLRQRSLALGGELHADCEKVLLEHGSKQEDLWGFNIYPDKTKSDRLEYTSLINIRPTQNNLHVEVKDEGRRQQMRSVIDGLID